MWNMIATWTMSYDGLKKAKEIMNTKNNGKEAILQAVVNVENNEYYKSVGYGGLPNEAMEVELDAAFMDGNNMGFGAVGSIKDFANPILIAESLSNRKDNNFLVGSGAEFYAHKQGFERKNMLTERAKTHYFNRLSLDSKEELRPYSGHDTVGMIYSNPEENVYVATSTSGLFMKLRGRLGDSPIIGSGYYADSKIGGASATGLGEDLMKGCVSYEIVKLMEQGVSAQVACERVVFDLEKKLLERRGYCGDLSVVAMDVNGGWGAASNIDSFSFVVVSDSFDPTIYITHRIGDSMQHQVADENWFKEYNRVRMQEVVKIYE